MTEQHPESSGKNVYLIPSLSILILVIFLAIYLFAWNPVEEQQQRGQRPPTPVRIEIVSLGKFVDSIEALGTTFAREAVNITAKNSGIVDQVHFTDGDQVKKGTILITLRNDEEKAKVQEAETTLAENRRQLERLLNLKKNQATARSAFEEQGSRVKESEAKLNVAKAQLNELIIRAPFDGVLGIRKVSPGSLVSPGTLISTLDDLEVIKVDFSVPETFLSSLSTGQTILANSSAWPDNSFQGVVTNISSRLDAVTRAINIRAELDNSDKKLRPGMLLTIALIKNQSSSMMVPETALLPIDSKQFIYKVKDDHKVSKVEVIIGRRRPGKVEILKGISIGDKIVYEGVLRLHDGSKVNILNLQQSDSQ